MISAITPDKHTELYITEVAKMGELSFYRNT